jgi:hypothetical protein
MSAEIVNMKQWSEDHPPAVRLVNITVKCWGAYWNLQAAIFRATWSKAMWL